MAVFWERMKITPTVSIPTIGDSHEGVKNQIEWGNPMFKNRDGVGKKVEGQPLLVMSQAIFPNNIVNENYL